jgi:hypothetical protein
MRTRAHTHCTYTFRDAGFGSHERTNIRSILSRTTCFHGVGGVPRRMVDVAGRMTLVSIMCSLFNCVHIKSCQNEGTIACRYVRAYTLCHLSPRCMCVHTVTLELTLLLWPQATPHRTRTYMWPRLLLRWPCCWWFRCRMSAHPTQSDASTMHTYVRRYGVALQPTYVHCLLTNKHEHEYARRLCPDSKNTCRRAPSKNHKSLDVHTYVLTCLHKLHMHVRTYVCFTRVRQHTYIREGPQATQHVCQMWHTDGVTSAPDIHAILKTVTYVRILFFCFPGGMASVHACPAYT